MNQISELLKSGAKVVDVRTPVEYSEGHVEDSINIPLNELLNYSEELRKMKGIIVCCASGIRSNKAANLLKTQGIECLDGGSWINLNYLTTI
jgi:phage shock protein E